MTAGRPLAGRTVVVTRAVDQAGVFVTLLEEAGARVMQAPTIAIEAPESWAPVDAALADLGRFTWFIFTSVNGVRMIGARLSALGRSWSALNGARVAAIGPATAAALEAVGVRAEVVPEEYRAEGLVECLRGVVGAGDRILLPRAAQTRDVLVRELAALGAEVTEVAAYRTLALTGSVAPVRTALADAGVDAVTFTSSSTARNFARLFTDGERRAWFAGVTVASIGPITAATAAEYGLVTAVMPSQYTIPALARAIAEHFARRPARSGAGPPSSEASKARRRR